MSIPSSDHIYVRADSVKPGDHLSLDHDQFMDPEGDEFWLEFEYAVVHAVNPPDLPANFAAPASGVLIEFETGELCAFPKDHLVLLALPPI